MDNKITVLLIFFLALSLSAITVLMGPLNAIGTIIGLGIAIASVTIFKISKLHFLGILVFAMVTLDAPWGKAFYELTPYTETIGYYFFSAAHKSLGIPGLSFSFVEIAFAVLALISIMNIYSRKIERHNAIYILASIPVAIIIFGSFVGYFNPNTSHSPFTQSRALFSLSASIFVGFYFLAKPAMARTLASYLVFGIFLKCMQSLFVFTFDLKLNMGSQQFLTEHVTSDFILLALFLCPLVFDLRRRRDQVLAFLVASPMIIVFALNDRRAALIGLALSIIMPIPFLERTLRRRVVYTMAFFLLVSSTYTALTWHADGILGYPARTISSIFLEDEESSRDYRKLENANL